MENPEFSKRDLLYIYGTFMKRIKQTEEIAAHPQKPIAKESTDQELQLCRSITDKIEAVYPGIGKLEELM